MSPRAQTLLAPLLALVLVLGCPKKKDAPADAGAVPIATASVVPSVSASAVEPLDFDDAGLADSTLTDIAPADGDASDGDARLKLDAYDDAPLMGAKTFPDENPMRGIRKITSNGAKVHKAPKDQTVIAVLPKGAEISLVAEIFDWYRVRYNDPNTDARRQGWIYVTTFAGPRMKTCPEGWTHHEQDGGWCDRECTKTTDCKALKGFKCSGTLCFYNGE